MNDRKEVRLLLRSQHPTPRGPRQGQGQGPGRVLVACRARPHLYLLAGDLRGAGGPGRGV